MDLAQFSRDAEALRNLSLFAALGDVKVERLARVCRRRRHERASTIVNVGETAGGLYVLLAGRAKVVFEDVGGKQITLGVLETNEVFGEMEAFDESEWVTGVKALTVCETLYIPKQAFLECIEGNFAAAILMLRTTFARLRRADRKIASLGLLDVYARVARVLVESAEKIDGEWIVVTGAEEIARSVAASREMVSRVVRKMAAKGLVRKEKRKMVILDWALLTGATADASSRSTPGNGVSRLNGSARPNFSVTLPGIRNAAL